MSFTCDNCRFSFVYFETQEDAVLVLQNGMNFQVEGKMLTVTLRTRSGHDPQHSPGMVFRVYNYNIRVAGNF